MKGPNGTGEQYALTENFSRKIKTIGKIQMKMLEIKENVITDHRFLQCAY